MVVYKDCTAFVMFGEEVNIYSEELDAGTNTVVEIKDQFYYLGHDLDCIAAAISAWQGVNGRSLTTAELHKVMVDNGLTSEHN